LFLTGFSVEPESYAESANDGLRVLVFMCPHQQSPKLLKFQLTSWSRRD